MHRRRPVRAAAAATLASALAISGGTGIAAADDHVDAEVMYELTVTVTNLAPTDGTLITPVWLGLHDGSFDILDHRQPASAELERLAEDGNTGPISALFAENGVGRDTTAFGENGPLAPGDVTTATFFVSPSDLGTRYLSYASMVIPSNDAFVANGNSLRHRLFNRDGDFVARDFTITGAAVRDAGTEVNDEIPENTAALAQAAPDTGVDEDGVIRRHPGFIDDGNILAARPGGDFTADGYEVARVEFDIAPVADARPYEVTVTISNLAPEAGTILTPFWVGLHNGIFDVFDRRGSASPQLERLVEDGNTGPLTELFAGHGEGQDTTAFGENGPLFPGDRTTVTFMVDANDPGSRYLSFASMVIPSNDAFIGNPNRRSHPVFNRDGEFIGEDILVVGRSVYDAGTEVNDEIPENTAALAQAAPNTGVPENGTIVRHPGFLDGGNILAAIPAGDFTDDGYQVASIDIDATPLLP